MAAACNQVESFNVPEFPPHLTQYQTELCTFLRNGLYYQSIGNAPGALVSYSNAEVYLHLLSDANITRTPLAEPNKSKLGQLEQRLLGYIELLTEKTKNLVKTGSNSKEEEKSDYSEICKSVHANIQKGKNALTYDDVIGLEKEKVEVEASFVKPLLYPNLYPTKSKGMLFYGSPGTGKTFLAKAMITSLSNIDPHVGVIFFDPTGGDLKGT